MPLSAVERIERVPLSEIEYADGAAVLQYGGELLPLEDEDAGVGGVGCGRRRNRDRADLPAARNACGTAGWHRGARVLDVSPGTLLAADRPCARRRLAMVKDRVTTLHGEFAGQRCSAPGGRMSRAGESRTAAVGSVSLCSLRAGTGLYGVDTPQIREVLGPSVPQRVPLAPEYIAGVVPYRGEVLTTVSFRALLGLERGAEQAVCWCSTTTKTTSSLG